MLKVGRVIDTGGQHHNRRIFHALWRCLSQGIEKPGWIVPHWFNLHRDKKLGKGLGHHAAIGNDVAHTRWHTDVVFENSPATLFVSNQVNSCDLDAHIVGRHNTGCLAEEVG